jgi:L-threonylcarbamoyladenylate synthase
MPSRPEHHRTIVTTDVGLAAERLRAGGLVAVPTETVYGLAADAEHPAAVRRVFDVKGRPPDHPLIVHVAGVEALDGWVAELPVAARALAAACWPGPLTMLLHRGPRASDVVTGGRPTIGVRCPGHPLTLELLGRHGGGLAAPSANRFGRVSPTRVDHVLADIGTLLDPDLDLVLDGGPCEIGVESTIVDLTVSPIQVLRAGGIPADEIERIVEAPVADAAGPSRASGMLEAHYAPVCEVVPVPDRASGERESARRERIGQRVGLVDRSADVVAAARHLYDDLRAADAAGWDAVVVVEPPPIGLGVAVRDRLRKAAAGSR